MLVGFTGLKGAGKDTCADYLVNNCGFVKKSFADPLKKACQCLFLFNDAQVYGEIEEKERPDRRWFDCTPRKALQYVGTDLLRDHLDNIMPGLAKNVFVHHFKIWYEAAKLANPDIRVVISDVRFANEAEYIKQLGGQVIRIDRPTISNTDTHQSELSVHAIKPDHVINNDSSKDACYAQLLSFTKNP